MPYKSGVTHILRLRCGYHVLASGYDVMIWGYYVWMDMRIADTTISGESYTYNKSPDTKWTKI